MNIYLQDERKCRYQESCSGATITGYTNVLPHRDEALLKVAVANVGPVSVAIDASRGSFLVCMCNNNTIAS